MATTALIVDLLVVGVFATIWIGLLAFTFIDKLPLPWSFQTMSALLIPYLSVAYSLGVVINRICDQIFKPIEEKILKKESIQWKDKNEYVHARLVVFHKSQGLTAYIDKLWALIRIFRSTIVNSVFLTCAWILFIWWRQYWSKTTILLSSVGLLLLEIALLILLWRAWTKKTKHYHKNLMCAYKIVSSDKE